MNLWGQDLAQILINVIEGGLVAVVGILLRRVLLRVETNTADTAQKVSQLDLISTGSWQTELESRVEALADDKSAELAQRLTVDRRLQRIEKFVMDLDAYAHGRGPIPEYVPVQSNVTLTEGLHGYQPDPADR